MLNKTDLKDLIKRVKVKRNVIDSDTDKTKDREKKRAINSIDNLIYSLEDLVDTFDTNEVKKFGKFDQD